MINPKATYKVTKIKVNKENSDRYVKAGDTFTGNVDVSNPQLGMVVDAGNMWAELQTSPIEKIFDCENGNFLVQTLNSTYSVELVND